MERPMALRVTEARSRLGMASACRLTWLLCAALLPPLSVACSDTPTGTIAIVTDEPDVLTRAPQVVTLVTERIAIDGSRSEITRVSLPADNVDLGERPRTEVGAVGVSGLDATGARVIRGETLFVQWGALEAATLKVFVQRTGELARLPSGPSALDVTAASTIVGRYVLAASGATAEIYDLLALETLPNSATLPRPAKSLAALGTAAVLIDDSGATAFDLTTSQTYAIDAPSGGTFAEVSGGARVTAPDGTQYIVGGTRPSGSTTRILVIDPDGSASFASTTAAREGACATYVEGRGLVVIGGDTAGAGAELLAPKAAIASPLPFPPDTTRRCGATTLDNSHVAYAGGADSPADTGAGSPVRVLDLACTTSCTPSTWTGTETPLVRAESATLSADAILIVGDDKDGASHVVRASPTNGKKEIPLKVARRGGRLVVTPASLVVLGGGAGIEQYLE